MRISKHIILLFLLIAFIFSERSLSQTLNPSDYNTWAAGLKFGTLPFYGDVRQMKYSADDPYRKMNTGLAFEGIKDFNQTFGAKVQLLIGNLAGSSPNLGLHFNSRIEELSVLGVVNLNDLISYYPRKDKIINIYMFAGFGMLGYRAIVRTYNDNNFVAAYGYDSTGVKTTLQSTAVFPFGIGIKLKANPKIDVGFELTMHLTNTTKLDAWSYKNSYNDRYSFVAVSLTYKIGKKKEYVEWVNPFKDTSTVKIALSKQTNDTNTTKINNKDTTSSVNKTDTITKKDITNTANSLSITGIQNLADAVNKVFEEESTSRTIPNTNKTDTLNAPIVPDTLNKPIIPNTTQPVNTSLSKDTAKAAIIVDPPASATVQNKASTNNTKKYYIVAGTFSSEKEASNVLKDFKANGFPDAEVIEKNDRGNWLVCYKGCTSSEDANHDLLIIKKDDPAAWVFEKK